MRTSRCFTDDFHNQEFSNADHDYILGQKRQIVLDQIRIVDNTRLIKKPGSVSGSAEEKTQSTSRKVCPIGSPT